MTVKFYQCRHCSRYYEFYQSSCCWCGSPLRAIFLDGKKMLIDEVPETLPHFIRELLKDNQEKAKLK